MLVSTRSTRKDRRRAWPQVEELASRDLPAVMMNVIIEPQIVLVIVTEFRVVSPNMNGNAIEALSRHYDATPNVTPTETAAVKPAAPPASSTPTSPPALHTALLTPTSPVISSPVTSVTTSVTGPLAPTTTDTPSDTTSSSMTTTSVVADTPSQSSSNTSTPPTVNLGTAVLGSLSAVNTVSTVAPAVATPTAVTTSATVGNPFIQTAGPSPLTTQRPGEIQLLPAGESLAQRRNGAPTLTLTDAYHSGARSSVGVLPEGPGPAEVAPAVPMMPEMGPTDEEALPEVFAAGEGQGDELFDEPTTLCAGLAWGRDIAPILTPLAIGLMAARLDRGRKRKDRKEEEEESEE